MHTCTCKTESSNITQRLFYYIGALRALCTVQTYASKLIIQVYKTIRYYYFQTTTNYFILKTIYFTILSFQVGRKHFSMMIECRKKKQFFVYLLLFPVHRRTRNSSIYQFILSIRRWWLLLMNMEIRAFNIISILVAWIICTLYAACFCNGTMNAIIMQLNC